MPICRIFLTFGLLDIFIGSTTQNTPVFLKKKREKSFKNTLVSTRTLALCKPKGHPTLNFTEDEGKARVQEGLGRTAFVDYPSSLLCTN